MLDSVSENVLEVTSLVIAEEKWDASIVRMTGVNLLLLNLAQPNTVFGIKAYVNLDLKGEINERICQETRVLCLEQWRTNPLCIVWLAKDWWGIWKGFINFNAQKSDNFAKDINIFKFSLIAFKFRPLQTYQILVANTIPNTIRFLFFSSCVSNIKVHRSNSNSFR